MSLFELPRILTAFRAIKIKEKQARSRSKVARGVYQQATAREFYLGRRVRAVVRAGRSLVVRSPLFVPPRISSLEDIGERASSVAAFRPFNLQCYSSKTTYNSSSSTYIKQTVGNRSIYIRRFFCQPFETYIYLSFAICNQYFEVTARLKNTLRRRKKVPRVKAVSLRTGTKRHDAT